MDRDDIEGAKAAAEYFLELYPYVYVTGDLDALSEMSHSDCQFCESVISNVEGLHADGGFADGPVIEVLTLEAAPPDDEYEYYSVWIEATEAASSRYDRHGDQIERIGASSLDINFAVIREGGEWSIRGVVGTDVDRQNGDT